ncbi:MAG: hypothetical protein HOE69_01850 [Euryarchaeota archaeon]|nr:hypothetical protein [Euryarchaeota archaeon]
MGESRFRIALIPLILVTIMLMSLIPQQLLPDLITPRRTTTTTETFIFDETVYHTSRKDFSSTPYLLLQTNSISLSDMSYCLVIQTMVWSGWDCTDLANGGSGSTWDGHYLEYEDYTLEAYIEYSYKIRHTGSATIKFETSQSGTSSPVTTSTIQSSTENFDTEVKASLHLDLVRKYRPDNVERNRLSIASLPFPSYGVDIDGSGNYEMIGNYRIYLWDQYTDLSTVSSTNGLGSNKALDGSINLFRLDLLELAAEYFSGTTLGTTAQAFNYFIEVNFEIDLDLELDVQSVVQPFVGTSSAYSLRNQYYYGSTRSSYGCDLGFTDALSSYPIVSQSCSKYLSSGATSGTAVLGTAYTFTSHEQYSTYIRIRPQSGYIQGIVWNLFTSQSYYDIQVSSGSYSSTTTSKTSVMTSASATFSVPQSAGGGSNQAPVAVLSVTPTQTSVGNVVSANTMQSSDADGDSFNVYVAWGDGSNTGWVSKGTHTHTYNNSGTYAVSVWAYDGTDQSTSVSRTVVIQEAQNSGSAQLSLNRSSIVEGESVTFTYGSSGTSGTLNYYIDLGDGTNYSSTSPGYTQHTFDTEGTNYVNLYVYNSDYSVYLTDYVEVTVGRNTSSVGLNQSTFRIVDEKILIVIDDDNQPLFAEEYSYLNNSDYVTNFQSQMALFESLSTVSQITNYDWDIHIVGDTDEDNLFDTANLDGPGLGMLEEYRLVIWSTGYDFDPFTSTDESNLEIYVDAGGRLVLFSQDYLWGACSSCSEWDNDTFANATLGVSRSYQDSGTGPSMEANSGDGMYNIGYLPLAGLDYIDLRNVTSGNGYNISYQDSIFEYDAGYELALVNSTIVNGNGTYEEVSHGIAKMHLPSDSSIGIGSRTAFFAFDSVQFRYRYDMETMMMGIFNWALDEWNDKSNISNASVIAVGTEGTTTIGPDSFGASSHAASLVDWHKVRIPAGRTYDFEFAPTWSWNGNSSGCLVLLNDVGVYDESGANLLQTFSCDTTRNEWSLSFTAPETAVYAIRVQAYDFYPIENDWGYWYHVNVTDAGDDNTWLDCYHQSGATQLIVDGSALSDTVQPYTGSSNSEDYYTSCFELAVVAGTAYSVTLSLDESSWDEFGMYAYNTNSLLVGSTDDTASGGMDSTAEIAFISNQTGTVFVETWSSNYSHPLLAKGGYTIQAWTLPSNHPVDDYLNATNAYPVNSTQDGWVDSEFDSADWWSLPVASDEPLTVEFSVDREGEYAIWAYWIPENDPYNWSYVAQQNASGNTSLDLGPLFNGEIRLGVTADWGRTNYSIEISETDESPSMVLGELNFAEVGIVDSSDTWELDLSKGTPLVIRGGATPSFITQNSVSTLMFTLTTPSGTLITPTYSQSSTNLTLEHLTTEDGIYTISAVGSMGAYWLWSFIDDNLVIDSYPQRYATAEVQFIDTVMGNQTIISEKYGHWLSTWQSYTFDQAPSGMSINSSTGEVEFTPTRQQVGNHAVSVRVSNDYGTSIWQNFTLVVSELPNSAPVLTDLGNLTSSLGTQMAIQLQAFDADNDTLTFSIVNGPAGSSINNVSGLIYWTPTSIGSQLFDVMVEDEHGLSHNLSFVVMATNDAPIPASLAAQQIGVGQTYTDSLSATDSEGHSTMWGMRSGPTGLTIATSGLTSWTPAANQVGIHTVIAEVADSYGETSVMWWTIEVMNTAPSVTQVDDASLYPGQLLDINLSMVDGDGHYLWATLIEGPSGLSIDDRGHILWIPYANQIGEHDVEILVVDSFGSTSTISFTVDVLNSNPTLVELRYWQDLRHSTLWVLFEAADVDGHATSFTCVSQELVSTRVGENNHLIEWNPTSTEESLSTTCSAVDGYGGLASLQVELVFTVPDLSLEVISEDTFAYEVPITAILQSGINLTSVEVESLARGSAEVSENQDGTWDLTYTPANNESGPITVLISATTDVGDELQIVWSFTRESEDLSWTCSVSQMMETEDNVVGIWTECSRPDVIISTETMSGQVDESSTPLSWTGLGYGDYSLVMIYTGPDGVTTTEMVTWNNPHPVARGQIDDVTVNLILGDVMTLQLTWTSENTSAPYCREMTNRTDILVTSDCEVTLTPNMTGKDVFNIQLMEGSTKLDDATIVVQVYEPEVILEEEKSVFSELIISGVGGLILGLLIFGATLQMMGIRKAGKKEIESLLPTTTADPISAPQSKSITITAPPPPATIPVVEQTPIIDEEKCQVDENGVQWFNDENNAWWYKSLDTDEWAKSE